MSGHTQQNADRSVNVVPMPRRPAAPPREDAVVPPATPAKQPATPPMVPYKRWQRACEQVGAALLSGKTRLVVTGPAGVGKSLLLEHVARVVRAAGWTVTTRHADATPPAAEAGGQHLHVVDEADRLTAEQLRQLCRSWDRPLLLAGLDVPRLPGATMVALPALSREEARDFAAQWLGLTGRDPSALEVDGLRRLVELAGGAPRLLSTLLGAACWLAGTSGDASVTRTHVEEAAALRASFAPEAEAVATRPRRRAGTQALPVIAASVLLGAAAFGVVSQFPSETRDAAERAAYLVAGLQRSLGERVGAREPARPAAPPPVQPRIARAKPQAVAEAVQAPARQAALSSAPAAPVQPASIPTPPTPTPTPQPAAPRIAPGAAAPAVSRATAQAATVAAAAATPPPASVPAPVPIPVAPPPTARAAALPPATVELLLRRGQDMLAVGDVSAARLLFGRAAEAGDAEAMLDLGRTFDPAILAGSGLLLAGDPVEAARWYRRAAAAGAVNANDLLSALAGQRGR